MSLVLFETCLHSVLDIVFLALQFGCDQIQASLCSPHLGFFLSLLIFLLLCPTFWIISLPLPFSSPLFRLSDLLISLSIELQRFFFHFYSFFFPNPPGLFIVFCSLHMFLKLVLNFFKHRKKLAGSCFITCLLILASYIYMGLFLADSCLWDLFKLFLNCAIFLGKLFVGVL